MSKIPMLGYGLGLRSDHLDHIVGPGLKRAKANVDWFEAIAENYMGIPECGQSSLLSSLLKVRQDFPIVLHCVSANLGGADPVDLDFLERLNTLIEQVEPEWVSDHLCWTGIHGLVSHELLPLPYTQETIDVVVKNISQVQDSIGLPFLIENASSYISYKHSEMTEWEFLTEIVNRTGCSLLLDINNIYVSSQNHDFNPKTYIDTLPLDSVVQVHLAGHQTESNGLIVDTHDNFVCDEVFQLLNYTFNKMGARSLMIEWDSNIPPFELLCEELLKARYVVEGKLNL